MIHKLLQIAVATAVAAAGSAQEGQRPPGQKLPRAERPRQQTTQTQTEQTATGTTEGRKPGMRVGAADGRPGKPDGEVRGGPGPRELFQMIDRDGDGMLDEAEVAHFRSMVEKVMQEARERRQERAGDRKDLREDHQDTREDRQDLREDRRDGDRAEVRDDRRELRDDRQDTRDDRRDLRQDRPGGAVKLEGQRANGIKPTPVQGPAQRGRK